MSNFSIVCGTRACNAHCPFCISKMTEACKDELPINFDWQRFDKAMRYVQAEGIQTTLITGRGEPTLYQDHLAVVISKLNDRFPCVELQTNGVLYREIPWDDYRTRGLNTVAVSVASLDDARNNQIMRIRGFRRHPNMPTILVPFSVRDCIKDLSKKFTVRVSFQVTGLEGGVHKPVEWFRQTIADAQQLGAEQITFRVVGTPSECTEENREIYAWVKQNGDGVWDYPKLIESLGRKVATYHWGGTIYDVNGMSVCIAECLTEDPNTFEPRSWIFDGRNLRYSWQYKGAIIF